MKKCISLLLAALLALSMMGTAFAAAYTDKDTVKQVQQALNDAGYDCGAPDGIAGKKTAAAITQYQTDKGLEATGVIDDALLEALEGKGEMPEEQQEAQSTEDAGSAGEDENTETARAEVEALPEPRREDPDFVELPLEVMEFFGGGFPYVAELDDYKAMLEYDWLGVLNRLLEDGECEIDDMGYTMHSIDFSYNGTYYDAQVEQSGDHYVIKLKEALPEGEFVLLHLTLNFKSGFYLDMRTPQQYNRDSVVVRFIGDQSSYGYNFSKYYNVRQRKSVSSEGEAFISFDARIDDNKSEYWKGFYDDSNQLTKIEYKYYVDNEATIQASRYYA